MPPNPKPEVGDHGDALGRLVGVAAGTRGVGLAAFCPEDGNEVPVYAEFLALAADLTLSKYVVGSAHATGRGDIERGHSIRRSWGTLSAGPGIPDVLDSPHGCAGVSVRFRLPDHVVYNPVRLTHTSGERSLNLQRRRTVG